MTDAVRRGRAKLAACGLAWALGLAGLLPMAAQAQATNPSAQGPITVAPGEGATASPSLPTAPGSATPGTMPSAPPHAAAAVATTGASGMPGIQGQNIFEVKPEASDDPNYRAQTNGERMKVQPGNNAPMWRQVGRGVTGYSSLPFAQAPEAGNLIQPPVQYPGSRYTTAGEAWRQVRNDWLIPYGAALLFITVLALGIFYLARGPIGEHGRDTGRRIERFTPFERAVHWSNAIAFVVLALSGLVMAFGRFFLMPVMGKALFGPLTYALKTIHNFMGPLFVVSMVLLAATFIGSNWPRREDLTWVLRAGGVFGGREVPSHRFNAGEKLVFWGGVMLLGVVVILSGLFLDKLLPGFVYTRGEMQIAHMVHATATLLMIAVFLGHIYMGTIGMHGSYRAMRDGWVDETWAREHHELWYDDVAAGRIPAVRSAEARGTRVTFVPPEGRPT